jgi:hypothetical protein
MDLQTQYQRIGTSFSQFGRSYGYSVFHLLIYSRDFERDVALLVLDFFPSLTAPKGYAGRAVIAPAFEKYYIITIMVLTRMQAPSLKAVQELHANGV